MKKVLLPLLPAFTLMCVLCAQHTKYIYPEAPRGNVIEELHGQAVPDPYRWLENTDSSETGTWVAAENKLTNSYLESIPGRDKIKARLTQLADYERYTLTFQRGGRYFFLKNDGLQNQSVYYTAATLRQPEKVLLNPNTLRADGTAAVDGFQVSRDGKMAAYAIAQAGSDWSEWRIRDIATATDRPDLIQWTKFSNIAWNKDNTGFYYSRYPQPEASKMLTSANVDSKLYYHRLGDSQAQDRLVYERPDQKEWRFSPLVTEDGRYLIIHVARYAGGSSNLLFYQDLSQAEPKTVELIKEWKANYDPIGTSGSIFYLVTTDGAPKSRIVSVDVTQPEHQNWHELVPEQPETLVDAVLAGGRFAVDYLKDAHSEVKLYSTSGKFITGVQLPGLGNATLFGAQAADKEIFYRFVSFTNPGAIYRLDVESGHTAEVRHSKLSFDPSKYTTTQVFYPSKDGTRIPMFIVHRKDLKLDGQNPTILYGYGGFNIALTPAFNSSWIAWLEMGGVYASANLRGGSEYGEAWHQAGTRGHKQNVFDDFIAAGEWLIANKYTSTPKLAIFGGSNGGLLVGAVLNQRPDLFGAAMPAVGVMDMLRFQKFTVGAGWTGDYGSSDNPDDFKTLRAYSPYHNIRPGVQYPPTLITTSDHDDRVVPGHSFKYAAALQAAQEGPAPILIRVETRAGHGAGKPITKTIAEMADRLAFLTKELHMNVDPGAAPDPAQPTGNATKR